MRESHNFTSLPISFSTKKKKYRMKREDIKVSKLGLAAPAVAGSGQSWRALAFVEA